MLHQINAIQMYFKTLCKNAFGQGILALCLKIVINMMGKIICESIIPKTDYVNDKCGLKLVEGVKECDTLPKICTDYSKNCFNRAIKNATNIKLQCVDYNEVGGNCIGQNITCSGCEGNGAIIFKSIKPLATGKAQSTSNSDNDAPYKCEVTSFAKVKRECNEIIDPQYVFSIYLKGHQKNKKCLSSDGEFQEVYYKDKDFCEHIPHS